MPFYVVEFEEGGLAVVPSFWLTPRKKEVYWPPVKDTNLYKKLVKRQEAVDQTTWKLYCVQKVFCETDFESAEIKLKKAELTSNLDTSDEEASVSLKRKRRLRRFSSSCSSENENSPVKRPPALKLKKNIGSLLVEQSEQTVAASPEINEVISTPSSVSHRSSLESPIPATTPHRSTLLTSKSNQNIQIDAKGLSDIIAEINQHSTAKCSNSNSFGVKQYY